MAESWARSGVQLDRAVDAAAAGPGPVVSGGEHDGCGGRSEGRRGDRAFERSE